MFDDLPSSVAAIYALRGESVTVEHSHFFVADKSLPEAQYPRFDHPGVIFSGPEVDLILSDSTFESTLATTSVGSAISCYGATIKKCTFALGYSGINVRRG